MKLLTCFLLYAFAAPSVFCGLADLQNFLHLTSSASAEGKCDVNRVNLCFEGYAQRLGLSEMPKDSQKYMDQLQHIYKTETTFGFIRVCRAFNDLRLCAGRSLYPCMTEDSLMKNFNLDKKDAAAYHYHALGQKFNCGPGFRAILKSFACMMEHAAEANQTLQRCQQEYIRNVTKEPKKVCEFGQDWANCYSDFHTKTCGKVAGWVICKNYQIAFRHSEAHCNLNCHRGNVPQTELAEFTGIQSFDENCKCDKDKYVKCGLAYGKDLDYNFTADPKQFLKFLEGLYAKEGAKGFIRVCEATHKWHKCLGWAGYFGCINIQNLMKMGLSGKDASIYMVVADQMAFECGPILPTLIKNFQCMGEVVVKHNDTLQACTNDFIKDLEKDPKEKCMHTEQYMMCYSAPFGQQCGKELAMAFCTMFQAGYWRLMPECRFHCRVG